MKTKQELSDILDFVAEYASYLLGSGVHTSRVIRNAQRIGTSQGVDIQLSSFQKSIIITVHDERSGEVVTRVVKIPALPISFERNSDLSALSWDAVDEHLSLTDLRDRYGELIAKPRMDPIFVLLTVGLANASFCRLFGGDWTAVGIVFTSTLVGFSARQQMQAHAVNHFLVFSLSGFALRLVGIGLRLYGRGGDSHQPALSCSGRSAHQRGDRHRRRAYPDRLQPSDQRPAADRLHCRRSFGDVDDR